MAVEGGEYLDIVCYHAQQCAEKALKAVLLSRGRMPGRTHNLVVLLGDLLPAETAWEDLISDCALLTDFGVAPRYPGWEDVVGPVDVGEVLSAAERILGFVIQRLESSSK